MAPVFFVLVCWTMDHAACTEGLWCEFLHWASGTLSDRMIFLIGTFLSSYGVFVVLNAILACDTLEQAINRAGGKAGNKGYDVAVAAVEMVNLLAALPSKQ